MRFRYWIFSLFILPAFSVAQTSTDSLVAEGAKKDVPNQTFKYEFGKKHLLYADSLAHEMKLQLLDQKINEERLLRERNIYLFAGLFVLLVAAGLLSRLRYIRRTRTVIQQQKERAERSEMYKEQFLANMSHEIRTPMHAISGMTNILLRQKTTAEQKKLLKAISESADYLLIILNDILDLSKLEIGKINIESIPYNIRKVIKGVVDMLESTALEKGLSLGLSVSDSIPEFIVGDPTRLNQILLNLIGNAIKFTESGTVNVAVESRNDRLCLSIEDSGIGIPAQKIERIFDLFDQVNDSITRKYGGTGLGLSITKQLIELQGGRIWVESIEDQGSTFYVELPLQEIEQSEAIVVNLSDDELKALGKQLTGLKILLVEDDEFNIMVATDDLQYCIEDVEIEVAKNGVLGVEAYRSGSYDLILMDIQMPELSGYEATEQIRNIERSLQKQAISIIAMTAGLLKSEIDKCYEAGMDNYIPKPYKLQDLISTIHTEIKKSEHFKSART